jgi:two-component system sensor histidine kinase RpfC
LIDPGVLQDLNRLSTDPTFVTRLIRSFRIDTERLVRSISDGLASRRYDEVRDAAHALRGGSSSVGATQLVQIATRLENATQETLRIRAVSLTEELGRASSMALAALDRHVEERQHQSRY